MALTATITNITDNSEQPMPQEYHLMYIDVIKEVNKIPTAQLIVLDGDAAKQEFNISNNYFFAPGEEIRLELRVDSNPDATIFEGIIVRHRIKADKNGSCLTLDLKDKAFKLTTQRKSDVFIGQKDSQIIEKLLDKSGFYKPNQLKIKETSYEHPEIVQYYCTDWDFILSRADANGQWVLVDNDQLKIQVIPIEHGNQVNHTFTYGIDVIYDFEMEIDIRQEYSLIEGKSWNIEAQNLLEKNNEYQSIGIEYLGEYKKNNLCTLVHPVALKEEELKAWVEAKKSKSELSNIKGYLKVDGDGEIKLGDLIELKGIGTHFNGTTIVTGVRHQVSENGWQTDVQFGLSADWFYQRNDIVDTPAAGLVPAINGLHIGIVQDSAQADPKKPYLIKVWVPAFGENNEKAIVWARWASPYAGNKRGMFFKPETNDEVVLGFFNDDPRHAVILGSMYSKANPPNDVFLEDNTGDIKGIVTKGRNKILLVDKDNADLGNIFENSIKLSKEGIKVNTNKELNITATELVNITETKSVNITATESANITSKKIELSNKPTIPS